MLLLLLLMMLLLLLLHLRNCSLLLLLLLMLLLLLLLHLRNCSLLLLLLLMLLLLLLVLLINYSLHEHETCYYCCYSSEATACLSMKLATDVVVVVADVMLLLRNFPFSSSSSLPITPPLSYGDSSAPRRSWQRIGSR